MRIKTDQYHIQISLTRENKKRFWGEPKQNFGLITRKNHGLGRPKCFRKLFFSPPRTESHTTIHLDRLERFETGLFAGPSDEREGIKPSN